MNKILTVNYIIPGFEDCYVPYNSRTLLSDADIIFFKPNDDRAFDNYNHYWYEELAHVLNLGKTVFILLVKNNHKNIYSFVPSLNSDVITASGIQVYHNSKTFEPITSVLKDYWDVQSYIDTNNQTDVIFKSKNGDRALGLLSKYNAGHIILLPNVRLINRGLQFPNGLWNEMGFEVGKILIHNLSDIHNKLSSKIEFSIRPEWTDHTDFAINSATKLIEKVESNNQTIEKLTEENNLLLNNINEKNELKNLLFETGQPLEIAVIKALQLLGYSAENYDDGILELDQVILSPEGDRFIGECEGKDNKPIDITKFRQLHDALNEDFERDEIEEKAFGILFGNPQRLMNPIERNVDFTDKCKKGASREKIGLINTVDLFKVARYLSENTNEEYKINCRSAIKEQLGAIIQFPTI